MKVALYGRVSTDEQKQNQTINNQKRELEKNVKGNGHEIYDYYLDEGISGTIPFENRPEGKRLLEDAEARKFDFVLVLKTDRLGRNTRVMLNAVDMFSKLNIGFKSVMEPFDTQTPEGNMMFEVISSFSAYDLNNIRKNSMRGRERALEEGRWTGGVAPYAYILNKETKKLELYDKKVLLGKYSEVDIMKWIFEWCAVSKISCNKIAVRLHQMKIPPYTPGKNKLKRKNAECWSPERVRNLLSDETFMGEKIMGKRSSSDSRIIKVPPIVSREIWEIAQEVKKNNKIISLRNTKRKYLLTGKIECSVCNRSFTGLAWYDHTYYACRKYRLLNVNHHMKCINKAIRADILEDEVWNDLKSFIDNPATIKDFLHQRLSKMSMVDTSEELSAINRKLNKVKKDRSKLVSFLRVEDSYLEKDLKVEIAKIKLEEEELLKKKQYYEDISQKEEFEKRKISEIDKAFALFTGKVSSADFKLKKAIINILVDKIVVHPYDEKEDKRSVEIRYSFNKNDVVIIKSSLTAL